VQRVEKSCSYIERLRAIKFIVGLAEYRPGEDAEFVVGVAEADLKKKNKLPTAASTGPSA
jgi:hypothetical protein